MVGIKVVSKEPRGKPGEGLLVWGESKPLRQRRLRQASLWGCGTKAALADAGGRTLARMMDLRRDFDRQIQRLFR